MAKKIQKIVVDSSVVVKWVNEQEEKWVKQADRLLTDWEKGKVELFAPELLKYEVGNALLYKRMPLPAAQSSLATVHAVPITFVPHDEVQAREAMEIAYERGITYYDAVFLSLARHLSATLVTDNPKHQQKTPGVCVLALKNYR